MCEKVARNRKGLGRPRTNWQENLKWAAGDDWREKTQERIAWRRELEKVPGVIGAKLLTMPRGGG